MIGTDFTFEQGVTTVPSMTARERAQARSNIHRDFVSFYRDNFFRFSAMYNGSVTIQDIDIRYEVMLPDNVSAEMAV